MQVISVLSVVPSIVYINIKTEHGIKAICSVDGVFTTKNARHLFTSAAETYVDFLPSLNRYGYNYLNGKIEKL